jgi:hypothetical protein
MTSLELLGRKTKLALCESETSQESTPARNQNFAREAISKDLKCL